MKIYASQGQQKSAILAYKLATIPIFKEYSNTSPVLLLDDIFSELDLKKRNRVLKYIGKRYSKYYYYDRFKKHFKKSTFGSNDIFR